MMEPCTAPQHAVECSQIIDVLSNIHEEIEIQSRPNAAVQNQPVAEQFIVHLVQYSGLSKTRHLSLDIRQAFHPRSMAHDNNLGSDSSRGMVHIRHAFLFSGQGIGLDRRWPSCLGAEPGLRFILYL